MKSAPAISVVIPVYNVEKFLPRCLDSVLYQTFSDWEAVCVNDGSPDGSDKILASYAAGDARFKIVSKENGGLSDARNAGVRAARGKYILFLDSDDFIHPQTLEILYNFAILHAADMVSFRYDEKFHRAARRKMQKSVDISGLMPQLRNAKYNVQKIRGCVTDNILFHCTERNRTLHVRRPRRTHCFPVLCLYRRDLIADLKFIRGIIMEDFPWWSAVMLRRPQTVMIKTPLYFYMPNPASILNSSKALRMITSIATGMEYAFDLYRANATGAELKHYTREFLWPFAIIAMRKTRELDNGPDIDIARRVIGNLYARGVFDNPPNMRARKYLKRIKKFIGN